MKLLLLGAAGQLGIELRRRLSWQGCEIVATDQPELNIADAGAVRAAVTRETPDMLVNAAAYTAVDRAESDSATAWAANCEGPAILASACRITGIPLIHVSTDYVFDGTQAHPYREDDPVNPLGVYGRSKEAGERAVRDGLAEHVILRTAWLYSAHGHNFVKTMLRLAATLPALRVVADQRGSPTAAGELAAAIVAVVRQIAAGQGRWGTFHFAGAGAVTWHGFAEAIFAIAAPWRGPPPVVEPILTADYPTPARRPSNSVLDCSRIAQAYGIVPRPWREPLAEVLAELYADAPAAQARA